MFTISTSGNFLKLFTIRRYAGVRKGCKLLPRRNWHIAGGVGEGGDGGAEVGFGLDFLLAGGGKVAQRSEQIDVRIQAGVVTGTDGVVGLLLGVDLRGAGINLAQRAFIGIKRTPDIGDNFQFLGMQSGAGGFLLILRVEDGVSLFKAGENLLGGLQADLVILLRIAVRGAGVIASVGGIGKCGDDGVLVVFGGVDTVFGL